MSIVSHTHRPSASPPRRRYGLLLPLLLLVALACSGALGCTTTMTQMTTARALEPLHPQVAINASVPIHTVAASKLIDAGSSLADRLEQDGQMGTETITEEELRQLLDAAVAAKLFLPSITPEFVVRIGVTDAVLEGIDVGLRYNGNVIKADVKLQLWESADGSQQVAFDVGYGHHTGLVSSAVEWVTLTEFSRKDIDLALMWSMELGDLGRILLSPRVMLGHVSVDTKIPSYIEDNLPEELKNYDPGQFFRDEWLVYAGANAAAFMGYKHVFLVVEAGLYRLFFEPQILDQKRDYNSWAFSPALGLMVTF